MEVMPRDGSLHRLPAQLVGGADGSAGREALSPAVRLYVRYCARLARIGLPRAAHEGPLEYAERVAVARRDLALEVRAIAQRFALLRYADAPDGLADLRARVRAFRQRRAPRR